MSDKLDLLYLASNVFSKGGIERYSRAQIKALRELLPDWRIGVYSFQSPGQDRFEDPFPVDQTGRGKGFWRKILFALQVSAGILIHRPKLIWVNHIHLLPLAVLGRLPGIRAEVVLNVYGLEIWSGLKRAQQAAMKMASRIVADCHFTANYVIDRYRIASRRVDVVWDPVDMERFYPKEIDRGELLRSFGLPVREDSFLILILGRISIGARHKGYDRLIDLMHAFESENIVLVIAGDGDDRSRLEGRVRGEGLTGRVLFTGSIPESSLADVYLLADVFALISDRGKMRGEGIPLTPLEAAACGIPIIVGNQDGSQEAVQEGQNGYIVSPDDPGVIKNRVLSLYKDQDLRNRMGLKAREIALENFSYQEFKRKHQNILEGLLPRTA